MTSPSSLSVADKMAMQVFVEDFNAAFPAQPNNSTADSQQRLQSQGAAAPSAF
jgi:hypothetical protein